MREAGAVARTMLSTDGEIDLAYALPNFHVEYLRVEPPGVPTAFWRSVGPSHNVFVTESFIDELAAAAKQDPVAYRRALLDIAAPKTSHHRATDNEPRAAFILVRAPRLDRPRRDA